MGSVHRGKCAFDANSTQAPDEADWTFGKECTLFGRRISGRNATFSSGDGVNFGNYGKRSQREMRVRRQLHECTKRGGLDFGKDCAFFPAAEFRDEMQRFRPVPREFRELWEAFTEGNACSTPAPRMRQTRRTGLSGRIAHFSGRRISGRNATFSPGDGVNFGNYGKRSQREIRVRRQLHACTKRGGLDFREGLHIFRPPNFGTKCNVFAD